MNTEPYVILSLKWTRNNILTWWGPRDSGYTTMLDQAGLYDAQRVAARSDYYNNERETLAVPYQQAVLMVRKMVLLDDLGELIGRPFWVTDAGISLTKPKVYDEYRPRLSGAEAAAAQDDPSKPEDACCNNEQRGMNGGCGNCGDPCY